MLRKELQINTFSSHLRPRPAQEEKWQRNVFGANRVLESEMPLAVRECRLCPGCRHACLAGDSPHDELEPVSQEPKHDTPFIHKCLPGP